VSPIIYVSIITVLSLFATVFHIGVYFGRAKDEEKPFLNWFAVLPYGFSGVWGVIVILQNGMVAV